MFSYTFIIQINHSHRAVIWFFWSWCQLWWRCRWRCRSAVRNEWFGGASSWRRYQLNPGSMVLHSQWFIQQCINTNLDWWQWIFGATWTKAAGEDHVSEGKEILHPKHRQEGWLYNRQQRKGDDRDLTRVMADIPNIPLVVVVIQSHLWKSRIPTINDLSFMFSFTLGVRVKELWSELEKEDSTAISWSTILFSDS